MADCVVYVSARCLVSSVWAASVRTGMPRKQQVKPCIAYCDCGEVLAPCPSCNRKFCYECEPAGGYCSGCEALFCSCYEGRMRKVSWYRHAQDDSEECESCQHKPAAMLEHPTALPFFANQSALVDILLSSTSMETFFTLPTPAAARDIKFAFFCARQMVRESRHPQREVAVVLLERLKRKAVELSKPPGVTSEEGGDDESSDESDGDIDTEDGYDWSGAWTSAETMLIKANVTTATELIEARQSGQQARIGALMRALLGAAASNATASSAARAEPAVSGAAGPSVGQKRSHVDAHAQWQCAVCSKERLDESQMERCVSCKSWACEEGHSHCGCWWEPELEEIASLGVDLKDPRNRGVGWFNGTGPGALPELFRCKSCWDKLEN